MKKNLQKHIKRILILAILLLIIFFTIHFSDILNKTYENFSLWLYPKNENRNAELLKIILSFIGGLGIMYGLYISLKRVKAMEKGVEKQGEAIENQSKQIELTRKSQTDERFKNAVEHLGSDKEPIIIGGVAELHQIAKDNKEDYSEIIFNLLCSYIRTNSNENKNITILQTIFDYLFIKQINNPYLSYKANLKKSNLLGIEMRNYKLKNADLSDCSFSNITETDFENANLQYSYFFLSRLNNVNFKNSNFYKTSFYDATIENCTFENSREHIQITFIECRIKDIKFDHLKIIDWNFIACDIVRSSFNYSEIISSIFSATRFSKVDFIDLELFSSNDFKASIFSSVKMHNFIGTNILFKGSKKYGNFNHRLLKNIDELINSNTDLSGIDFVNANITSNDESLTKKEIENIKNDYETVVKEIFEKTKAERYREILNDELYNIASR